MAAPQLAEQPEEIEQPDDETPETPDSNTPDTPDLPDPAMVDEAEAVIGEDDVDSGGLFSGVEEGETDVADDPDLSPDTDDETDGETPEMPGLEDSAVAEAINEGAARLAVVGLEDDDEQDRLEDEFVEVFEAFRLGHFGAETADEYLLIDDQENVDPIWGLASAMAACAMFTVYMRPDRDEQLERFADTLGGMGGSGSDLL